MRLVSYRTEHGMKPGLIIDENVLDANVLLAATGLADGTYYGSVRCLLEEYGGKLPALGEALHSAAAEASRARIGSVRDVSLGPPVPDPAKVLCVGLNYRDHVAETGRKPPTNPDIFSKFATSLAGPSDDLALTGLTTKLDYEGELAVVVGKPCRGVRPEEALDRVAGAMVLNDTTARDLQFNGTQWLPGKALDTSTACGPALVTLDELGDPHDLELVTRVNDVEVQRARTDLMIFTIPTVISYVSHFLELRPGDVIATGTPNGVGSRREPPSFLSSGDVVQVEIDRLGSLRNRIR